VTACWMAAARLSAVKRRRGMGAGPTPNSATRLAQNGWSLVRHQDDGTPPQPRPSCCTRRGAPPPPCETTRRVGYRQNKQGFRAPDVSSLLRPLQPAASTPRCRFPPALAADVERLLRLTLRHATSDVHWRQANARKSSKSPGGCQSAADRATSSR
jgi:hypothetical protein